VDLISIIVFGWPSALAGGVLLVAGVATRKSWLSAAGAFVASGFCAYLALHPPPLRWFGIVAMTCNWLSVTAVSRGRVGWAVASLVPFALLAAAIGRAVAIQ